MIYNIVKFDNLEDAEKHRDEFLAQYSGAWNPYDGRARIEFNESTGIYTVVTSRNESAD